MQQFLKYKFKQNLLRREYIMNKTYRDYEMILPYVLSMVAAN